MRKSTPAGTLFILFLRSLHFMTRAQYHQAGGNHGQFRILSILSEKNSMSQKDLMEIFQARSASLSELLGKIESKGYITRTRDDDDKRNFIITITEKGRTTFSENEQQWQNTAEKLFAVLNEEEQNALSKLLLKLITAWQQQSVVSDSERSQQHHSSIHNEDHPDAHSGYHHDNVHHGERSHHGLHSSDEE